MLDTRAYLHFDMNVYVCVSLLLAWQIIALIQFTDKFYLNSFRCCCCACCSFLSLPAPAHSSCLSFSVQSLQHIASGEHQPASHPEPLLSVTVLETLHFLGDFLVVALTYKFADIHMCICCCYCCLLYVTPSCDAAEESAQQNTHTNKHTYVGVTVLAFVAGRCSCWCHSEAAGRLLPVSDCYICVFVCMHMCTYVCVSLSVSLRKSVHPAHFYFQGLLAKTTTMAAPMA